MKFEELEPQLRQFSPSQKRHRHHTGMQYTKGILYIINNCELRWLVDVIASFQLVPTIANAPEQWRWQSWEFNNLLYFFDIESLSLQPLWSNLFLLGKLQLIVLDGCLMLPSECPKECLPLFDRPSIIAAIRIAVSQRINIYLLRRNH